MTIRIPLPVLVVTVLLAAAAATLGASPGAATLDRSAATMSPSGEAPPVNGKIAFTRYDTAADKATAFLIDADGSHETKIGTGDVACLTASPDGTRLLCAAWFENQGARPTTANLDGSDFAVLDAYPARQQSMWCRDWLPDEARFLCVSDWERDADPADHGLYTVRASDGTDLSRLTSAPSGCLDTDQVVSPDGATLVFTRVCGEDEHGILFRVNLDGTGLLQLSPTDLFITAAFTGLSADWSPDSSQVAFGAYVPEADSTALYAVRPDGTGLRQIVSPDTGAVSARWSPDGGLIAFTSRYRSNPQVWLVHPDGSGLTKLTDGSDGSDSVAPVWSPDGSELLFANTRDDHSSLFIMRADGTGRTRLVDGAGPDWHIWLAAPVP